MKKSIILTLALILTQTIFGKDINVPSDYNKIQDAINAASDGDRILVASGNYSEFLNIEKSIKIIGTSPCTLYANTSPIKSVRNKKALINIADNEVSIEGINLVGTYLDNGKLSTAHPTTSYCTVAIDSKDSFLDIKSMTLNGFTQSYLVVNGGVVDVTNVELSPTTSIHPVPSLAFKLDDVGGLTIKGLTCINPKVKNILAINEVFTGVRESFILITDTEIGTAQLERGRKESYTISAVVNQKKKESAISNTNTGRTVNIPDEKFKTYLINNKEINTNDDREIQISEATAFKGKIDVTYMGIKDLTGIEAFTSLNELYCLMNELTVLDISSNKSLTFLHCKANKLTSLDLSNNPLLTDLWASGNKLQSIKLNNNINLEVLFCHGNKLTTLDISKNKALRNFVCQNNALTSLDLSKNINLENLACGGNELSNLNLNANVKLKELSCSRNKLKTIDVRNNIELEDFSCSKNSLSSLNVANNTNLKILNCSHNQLTQLNVSTNNKMSKLDCGNNNIEVLNLRKCTNLALLYCGANKIIDIDLSNNFKINEINVEKSPILETINLLNVSDILDDFFGKETPNLTCILVDDVNKSKEKWSKSIQSPNAIKSSCEGQFTEENETEEIPGSLAPLPPSKKSVQSGITYDPKSSNFNSMLDGKDYNFTLPQKLKYKSHNASIKELVVAYSLAESGDNYIGIWNEKLEYLGEYNFKKIEVKAYTPITTKNNQNIVLIHYYDPTYKSEFVGVFNNTMQYLGQYEFTGKKNIEIQTNSGNPSVVYLDGSKKKLVEFDVTGNQIAIQNL